MSDMRLLRHLIIPLAVAVGGCGCADAADDYMALADSATYYIERSEWFRAEGCLVKALRLHPAYPGNSLLLSNLGIVRTHLHNYRDALQAYEAGLGIGRDSTSLLNNRAYTYLVIDHGEEAEKDLDVSLGIDSLQQWPLRMSGLLALRRGDTAKASRRFGSLVTHFPDDGNGYYGLGNLALVEGDKEKALGYFTKSVEADPNEENLYQLILLQADTGRLPEAYETARAAVRSYPKAGNLFAALAYVYRLRYQYVESDEAKKIAVDNDADKEVIDALFPSPR